MYKLQKIATTSLRVIIYFLTLFSFFFSFIKIDHPPSVQKLIKIKICRKNHKSSSPSMLERKLNLKKVVIAQKCTIFWSCMEPPAPVVTACKDTGHILKSVSSFEILGSPNCVVSEKKIARLFLSSKMWYFMRDKTLLRFNLD